MIQYLNHEACFLSANRRNAHNRVLVTLWAYKHCRHGFGAVDNCYPPRPTNFLDINAHPRHAVMTCNAVIDTSRPGCTCGALVRDARDESCNVNRDSRISTAQSPKPIGPQVDSKGIPRNPGKIQHFIKFTCDQSQRAFPEGCIFISRRQKQDFQMRTLVVGLLLVCTTSGCSSNRKWFQQPCTKPIISTCPRHKVRQLLHSDC